MMMERKWMTTAEVVEMVVAAAGVELELRLWSGGCMFLTLWVVYDEERQLIGISDNWRDYDFCTPAELLEAYPGRLWEGGIV